MNSREDIIGVHYGHDATVVLLRDGKIVEAMSEERLSRQKKHIGFPALALDYLKRKYGLSDIKHVYVVGVESSDIIAWTKERNQKERELRKRKVDWFAKAAVIRSEAGRLALRAYKEIRGRFENPNSTRSLVEETIEKAFPGASVTFVPHHIAHVWAAVPFFPTFGERRLVFTLDGEGDGLSGLIAVFEKGTVKVLHEFKNTESIGLLYSSVVDVLGMARNEHEFKVMGLAPYAKASAGEVAYQELRKMLSFDTDAMTFRAAIDMRNATAYLVANNINIAHRFDSLAYGMQKLTEELVEEIVLAGIARYGTGSIAIGGGVFMNVKANQRLAERGEVTSLVVTPSCGDESLAIGAAVFGYAERHEGDLSELSPLSDLYLGSSYTDEAIKEVIDQYPYAKECVVEYCDPHGQETIERRVAALLAQNEVVGRFKHRAEWGARALGNRSILANPSSRKTVKLINEMIKGRDFWMPFATSMLEEETLRYLVNPRAIDAPYMAITFHTTEAAHTDLEAALHPYDLTSRPQMVRNTTNPEYHALIAHFKQLTGIGGILNTSFNLHGEPNVESPEDALYTFERSGLQFLALGNYLLSKKR